MIFLQRGTPVEATVDAVEAQAIPGFVLSSSMPGYPVTAAVQSYTSNQAAS